MTVAPIYRTLGRLPSGDAADLSVEGFQQYISKWNPTTPTETERRKGTRKRLDLYRDRGRAHFEEALSDIYKNPDVRQWRKAFIEFAEYQNITQRVVREISTVYAEPADRTLGAKDRTKRYKEFQKLIRQDRHMRQVNRLGNLTNDLLVWPDVTEQGPVQRIVTQDRFTTIPYPDDHLRPAAHIIDQFPAGASTSPDDPHYLLMSEVEFIWLNKDWRVVRGPKEHGLGRMPALLWHREEPDECLLDAHSGKDLISAHLAIALLNVMMLKHQKSGTKQPFATGDVSSMANGQPMDEEHLLQTPEGVSLGTLDLGADPRTYIDATRSVIKQIAANRGIPESVFDLSYQASSGFEIELKRSGLREIRRDQILDFRPFEQELASLWSVLLSKSQSEYAFTTDGWQIKFGEIDTPQDPMAKLDYWRKLEELGLVNRVQMYMEMYPEATEDEARAAIDKNLQERLLQMQAFQSQNSGVFTPRQPGGQPLNGASEPQTQPADPNGRGMLQ